MILGADQSRGEQRMTEHDPQARAATRLHHHSPPRNPPPHQNRGTQETARPSLEKKGRACEVETMQGVGWGTKVEESGDPQEL